MKTTKCLAIILLLSSFIHSQAGIIIKSKEKSDKMNVDMETLMYVNRDQLRIELTGPDEKQVIIFRGDKNLFWVINIDKETYSEMTQEDLKKLKIQMDNMQKMMMEQMKNMPEEQRKMMEKMMPPGMSKTKTVKTSYQKKASGQKVGKWTCDQYEGSKEGIKSSDLWIVSWEQLGIKKEDVAGFKKMAEFFEVISQDAMEIMKIGSEEWETEHGLSGIPVKWIDYIDGSTNSQGEITEILQKDLDTSLFDLPGGFEKEDSPWQQQGSGMNPY